MATSIRIDKKTLIDVANPDPRSICITDIARVLANIPRFNGHGEDGRRISVAEHSVNVLNIVETEIEYLESSGYYPIFAGTTNPTELKLAALLHDGHEFLVSDVATPVKETIGRAVFHTVSAPIDKAIGEAIGFNHELMNHSIVKDADRLSLNLESAWLFNNCKSLERQIVALAEKRKVVYRQGWLNRKPKIGLNTEQARHLFLESFEGIITNA